MGTLSHFEILLGVTGGIAAYKTAALCSRLVQNGAGVTVVMTAHAERFVGKLTFSALTGRHVVTNLFENPDVADSQHIRLTHDADLIVIAPATANIIAKTATGTCDDMLSTVLSSAQRDNLVEYSEMLHPGDVPTHCISNRIGSCAIAVVCLKLHDIEPRLAHHEPEMPSAIKGSAVSIEACFEKLKESPDIIALRGDERIAPVGVDYDSVTSGLQDATNLSERHHGVGQVLPCGGCKHQGEGVVGT